MRIGIVTEYLRPWPGGISEHVHHEAEALRRRGHQVRIITGGGLGATDDDVLRVGRALTFQGNGARSRLSLGSFAWRMRALLEKQAFDVLHVHAPLDPLLPLTAALSAPCPVVGTFHASFPPSAAWALLYGERNPLARRAASRLAVRVAVSEEARRSIARYCPGPYVVVPNGVDVERFRPPAAPRRAAKRLRILFVGRADARKGLDLLLDAHALLGAEHDVELSLCGVTDAQVARKLERLPAQARARVRTLGYVTPEELPQHYREADVFCSPATARESQGLVLLEAMASACPCVCFDIPGYREVVEDHREGLLVREQSAAALARTLGVLLRDRELRARLGHAGVARARRFAWPVIAEALEGELLRAARDARSEASTGAVAC